MPVVEGGLGVSSPEKGPWVRFLLGCLSCGRLCLVVREEECWTPPILPQCLYSGQGLHYPTEVPGQIWEVIGFFLPIPSPDKQPGLRDSSSKSPHCCCRALVWPPSSSPDSVHSLLPVSLPPRHSLPHVARGIFLKRTSGYFPSLHKSFRNALWPAG